MIIKRSMSTGFCFFELFLNAEYIYKLLLPFKLYLQKMFLGVHYYIIKSTCSRANVSNGQRVELMELCKLNLNQFVFSSVWKISAQIVYLIFETTVLILLNLL